MSDTDINPSLPPGGTTIDVPDHRTLVSDDNSNNTQPCANNHTGRRLLTHIIDEPGPNNNHNIREINTLTDRINLACNVHSSRGHGDGALRNSGITYTACRANRHNGMCLFDRGANGVICDDDVRVISMSVCCRYRQPWPWDEGPKDRNLWYCSFYPDGRRNCNIQPMCVPSDRQVNHIMYSGWG